MPLYDYICDECQAVFETQHGMFEKVELFCPRCKEQLNRSVMLKKTLSVPLYASVRVSKGDLKTLGHRAERNRETMSEDEREHLKRKHVTKKIGPDGKEREPTETQEQKTKKSHQKINSMSPAQKKKYIETGET
jgi:putative FmdB family regulatory protein